MLPPPGSPALHPRRQKCRCCSLLHHKALHEALCDPLQTQRTIASRFGVSLHSLTQHRRVCMGLPPFGKQECGQRRQFLRRMATKHQTNPLCPSFVSCVQQELERMGIERVLGVDFGIVNLALDSDGTVYTGATVDRKRQRYQARREGLQRHGTRSARRRLKLLKGKQARFQQDVNHTIAKRLVDRAQRSAAGIALEDLTGIRQRVKAHRSQRPRHANWGFFQLRQCVTYKAALAGVPVILVDPRHTSQECSHCGHIAKGNRPTQGHFSCRLCGYTTKADFNAAQNIKTRAAVNQRIVAQPRQLRLALA